MPDELTFGQLRMVLSELTTAGTLTRDQADAVLTAARRRVPPRAEGGWQAALAEVGGYVGGVFVFAAALVIGNASWDSLGTGAKVTLLTVIGVLLLAVAGAVGVRGRRAPRHPKSRRFAAGLTGARGRLASVLVVIAAGALAGAVGTGLDLDTEEVYATGTLALVAVAGYVLWRGVVLHLATVVAVSFFLLALVSQANSGTAPAGAVLVGWAAAWALLTALWLPETSTGVLAAGAVALTGAETLAIDHSAAVTALGYLTMAAVAGGTLTTYLRRRRLALIVVGVVTAAILVPQAVIDYTDGALGAAGSLLIVGLSVVGASVVGLRLKNLEDD